MKYYYNNILLYRNVVDIILNVGMFGVGVVMTVLVASNVNDMIKTFAKVDFDYCYLAVIVTIVVTPACLLKSPQDFWYVLIKLNDVSFCND